MKFYTVVKSVEKNNLKKSIFFLLGFMSFMRILEALLPYIFFMMDFFNSPFGGIAGLIHFIVFIWALLQILGSSMSLINKIVWILIVGLLPVLGLIIYLLVGRKA